MSCELPLSELRIFSVAITAAITGSREKLHITNIVVERICRASRSISSYMRVCFVRGSPDESYRLVVLCMDSCSILLSFICKNTRFASAVLISKSIALLLSAISDGHCQETILPITFQSSNLITRVLEK